jgi:hypothetical protein
VRQASSGPAIERQVRSTNLRRGASKSTESNGRALCLFFEASGLRAVRAEGEMALWRRRVVQRACGRIAGAIRRVGPVSKKAGLHRSTSRRDGMGMVDKGRYPVEPDAGLPIRKGRWWWRSPE